MGEASGSQREALVDLASDSDIDTLACKPEDAEREAHQNGKQREVDPEDDQEDLSPQFAADRPQSSPKKRKRAAEDGDESEEEREVERSIDISYHPSDLRQRFESGSHRAPFPLLDSPQGSEGGGSGAEEDADWTYGSIVFSPPTLPSAVQRALAGPTPPRGPPNPGPFRPPFDFPSPPRQTSQQLLSDDVAGPSQSSSAHPDQPWAPLSNVASSSSNWNGPLPSTPPQQTGQASRRLPRYLGDPLLAIAAMNDPRRNVIRREGPGQVVVGYDEERGEFRWAPGGRTTTEAQQALAANRARVLQPLRSSGVHNNSGWCWFIAAARRGIFPSHVEPPQPDQCRHQPSSRSATSASGWSKSTRAEPANLLRRHDTYLEGPNPWVIINSSNLGTVWPAPPPPVVPAAPVVQAPLLDHYPSPASSHEEGRVYGEAEDDEGLEYTDGEDNGDPEGEGLIRR
ncbi:hypothetical protein BKA70DRAFT_1332553 [Coprinopsis sp. MPI-PUGE-AT-0042]|nr:hypothetical protein BKA70DRAFT_1332553 [Coprinopsis sp. MPI-PUGE-AT-0042]